MMSAAANVDCGPRAKQKVTSRRLSESRSVLLSSRVLRIIAIGVVRLVIDAKREGFYETRRAGARVIRDNSSRMEKRWSSNMFRYGGLHCGDALQRSLRHRHCAA